MTNYYSDQLAQIIGDYKKIKITSDSGDTNFLSINLDSIEALQAWLDTEKNRILDELPACNLTQAERETRTGQALLALFGKSLKNGRIDTPIGDKTATGIYHTVKAILADSPECPRYDELFPKL